jgi:hypothetical protein
MSGEGKIKIYLKKKEPTNALPGTIRLRFFFFLFVDAADSGVVARGSNSSISDAPVCGSIRQHTSAYEYNTYALPTLALPRARKQLEHVCIACMLSYYLILY